MRTAASRIRVLIFTILACGALSEALFSQAPCHVTFPTASLSIPYVPGEPALGIDPHRGAMEECRHREDCQRLLSNRGLPRPRHRGSRVLDGSLPLPAVRVSRTVR